MKIAIIGPAYPYRGGIANFSERLAKELLSQQDEVQLYTFSMMYPGFIFPGKSQFADTPLSFPLSIKRNINSVNPLNWNSAGKEINKEQYDLVLAAYSIPFLSPSLGTIARKAKKNKHTKAISIIHNLNPHEKRIGDKVLSDYFLNSMDGHLGLSKKVWEDIKGADLDHKAVYYPHPVYDIFGTAISKQDAIRKLNLDPQFHYMLFFGLVRDYKGLDILLEAMSYPEIKKLNVKLLIAGEFYADKQSYLRSIEKNNLQERIILHDRFIPDAEVHSYFSAADVVVLPYKNATQSGITQIAYEFEKPMIVTDVGGLPETVPDNKVGYVCEPNAGSLARAILQFYSDNKEAEFIANCKIEKQKYSWSGLANAVKSLYLAIQ
jgi:glycosyltransferase involved in cell wall biosynthesis